MNDRRRVMVPRSGLAHRVGVEQVGKAGIRLSPAPRAGQSSQPRPRTSRCADPCAMHGSSPVQQYLRAALADLSERTGDEHRVDCHGRVHRMAAGHWPSALRTRRRRTIENSGVTMSSRSRVSLELLISHCPATSHRSRGSGRSPPGSPRARTGRRLAAPISPRAVVAEVSSISGVCTWWAVGCVGGRVPVRVNATKSSAPAITLPPASDGVADEVVGEDRPPGRPVLGVQVAAVAGLELLDRLDRRQRLVDQAFRGLCHCGSILPVDVLA